MITEFSKLVGIPEADILGRSYRRRVADARHVYWYLLYLNGFYKAEIARLCDCSRATLTKSIKRVEELIECNDKEIIRLYSLTKHIKRYGKGSNSIDLQSRKETVDISF